MTKAANRRRGKLIKCLLVALTRETNMQIKRNLWMILMAAARLLLVGANDMMKKKMNGIGQWIWEQTLGDDITVFPCLFLPC